jgi:FkbM family methyltransferase
MRQLHLLHQIKSFFIDRRPKGFGKALKIIDGLFFNKLPEGEVLIKTLHGFQLFVNPKYDKGIERKLYFTGSYEKGLLNVLDILVKPGDVIVDAGANIGLISIFCAYKVGEKGLVLSFEPHPETFPILEKNVALNHLSNIKAINKALGSENGNAKIYSNLQVNRGAASLVEFLEDSPAFDIKVETLDGVVMQNSIKKINLLKIDVEGFEMEVLKGARGILEKEDGPILVVECSNTRNNFNYSMEDLFLFLTHKYGYNIFKFSISKERVSKLVPVTVVEELPHHDNIVAFKDAQLQSLQNHPLLF